MTARRKRRARESLIPDQSKILAWHDELKARFIAESPLKNETTKAALAENLASLVVRQRILLIRQAQDDLTIEDGRSIAAVASNILKTAEALKATTAESDDELEL